MRSAAILSLAWRESRFARRRLFLFLSAISLGVAAVVAVQGFASNLSRGVRDQAKALLGADLELSSQQPFGPRTTALLDSLRAAGVPQARVTSFVSMALLPRNGATRLVQLRAPEPAFPFYGTIDTDPAGRWAVLQRGRNAIVDPALLAALGASLGDSIALGDVRFRIVATLEKVPGDAEIASAFAPRVYIPARYLDRTGLVQFGSRIERAVELYLPRPGAAEALEEAHHPLFRAEHVRSRTAVEQQQSLERAMGRLSDYLGLVGIFALLLGGIGVASAMGAYMAQKSDTVAVLRCLGATSRQVMGVYLAQAVGMGIAGAALGVVIGGAVQWVLPGLVEGLVPVQVQVRPDGLAALTGLGVGVWTALVFAALPLLRVRRISPLGALRRRAEPVRMPGRDWLRWAAWAALAVSVVLLFTLQAGRFGVGVSMAVGIAVALLLLDGVAWLLMRGARRLPHARMPYPLRQGIANLYRPGNQTRTVVVALGFGVFLLGTLLLVQHTLLLPLRPSAAASRANVVFWDVQEDQCAGVSALLQAHHLPLLERAPIVPMRIAAIDGRPVRPASADEDTARSDSGGEEQGGGRGAEGWALRREYRSTYRDSLESSETLTAGSFWKPGESGANGVYPVSLEEGVAGDLDVGLGDRIDWNVQGVVVPTRVTSLRKVNWVRFEPNFFAVFPSAALEAAPQTWVLLSRADSARARATIEGAVVARYPNVSALDLTNVEAALDDVLGRITTVIRFLAGFSVATGFIVLLGAVATSRLQRVRESVLLRTIGATRGQVAAVLATEYLALGLLSAVAGLVLSIAAGWVLAKRLFKVGFALTPLSLAVLGAAVAVLAVAIGLWASREVFRHTPMEAIREE
ncbi:MAG TPA: FtsX-like permease family protein [Longimicrobiaceae bacterium]|nr:FtsX-like permease family protein [Longimicrobiaceae bacterium]